MFSLAKSQPWLASKYKELETLLYQDCQTEDERQLMLELLERFVHITSDKFSELTKELVESVVTDNLTSETTQLVSMTGDYSSDSGQFVLYGLKPELERQDWREHLTVTNFQRSYREFNKHGRVHKNIVLIDEFVGSGRTVVSRISRLRQLYTENNVNDVSFYVKAIASTTMGMSHAKDNDINIECLICLDKGISDFYNSDLVPTKLALMERLESILSESYNDRERPKFGYGQTESLYVRDGGNTPNSVFPIFWWPFFNDQSKRDTMLIRAMGDA